MDEPRVTPRQYLTHAAIPALFLLLWSSGFIAAKTGLAHAETLTFLSLRYVLVTLLMTGVALVVARKLALGLGSAEGMAWAFVGLLGITLKDVLRAERHIYA